MSVRAFLVLFVAMACCGSSVHARKYASIVVDADTGIIHHQANPDAVTYPASLTKMMTLYLAFKALREGRLTLHQRLKVSKHASRQAPFKLWLKAGSTITVEEAIYAIVVRSANDVAVVLAEALGGGSEARFAQMMTKQARELGMKKTTFKNASGLPNNKQVTTARDMARLSVALYRDFPEYFSYFKTKNFKYKGRRYKSHNHLVLTLKGADGIKTGFIRASGSNVATSVVRNNRRLIAVVLGGRNYKSRDKHMADLIERTYRKIRKFGSRALKSMSRLVVKRGPGSRKLHTPRRAARPPLPPAKFAAGMEVPVSVPVHKTSLAPLSLVPVPKPRPSEFRTIEDLIGAVEKEFPTVGSKSPKSLRPLGL